MNKLLLLGLVLLLTIGSAFAVPSTAQIDTYLSFDNDNISGSTAYDSSPNNYDGTNVGATTGFTGKLEEAFDYNGGVPDYVSFTGDLPNIDGSLFFFNMWVYLDVKTAGLQAIGTTIVGGGSQFIELYADANGYFGCQIQNTGGYKKSLGSTDITGSWHMVTCTYDGSNVRTYLDGTLQQATAASGTFSSGNLDGWRLGGRSGGVIPFDGKIDEFLYMGNSAGNTTFITDLYNSNAGINPYKSGSTPIPSLPYFEVTAKDVDTSATLYNITVTLENGTQYTNVSNAIVVTGINDSSLRNFTVSVENYFNQTFTNYNTSADLQANMTQYPFIGFYNVWTNESLNGYVYTGVSGYFESNSAMSLTGFSSYDNIYPITNGIAYLPINQSSNILVATNTTDYMGAIEFPQYQFNDTVLNYYPIYMTHDFTNSNDVNISTFQAQLRMNATQILTGSIVSPSNYTIDGIRFLDSSYINLDVGYHNVTFSKSGYYDKTVQILVNRTYGLTNGVRTVSSFNDSSTITGVSDTAINITAQNILTTANINSFSLNVRNDFYNVNDNYTTTNGYIGVSSVQGLSFNITINASGYAIQNQTLTPNATLYNYTFDLYTRDSILFNIYDEVSGTLINGTEFLIQIIGSYEAINRTTSNGTLYVDLLTPDGYEIRYYSTQTDDYKLRSYFATVSSQSFQQIDLYALNDTSADITSAQITFVVYDQDLDPVEDARVTVSRYYINENAFLQVFSRDTNTAGQAVGTFETIDAFYQYSVKIGNTVYYTSSNSGTQFTTATTIPIYINLNPNSYTSIQTFEDIPTTLQYIELTNTTGYVLFNWSYQTSIPVCLYVDEVTVFGSGYSDSSCSTGASGSIQLAINTSGLTKDYVARSEINYNGLGYKIKDRISFTVNKLLPVSNDSWKDIATLIAIFAIIMGVMMSIKYPAVAVVLVTSVFVLLTIPPLQLINVGTTFAMWGAAMALLLLFKLGGNR